MIHTIENSTLQLNVSPQLGRWNIHSHLRNGPSIDGIQVRMSYRDGISHYQSLQSWRGASVSAPELVPSPHGPLQQLTIHIGADKDPLRYILRFALSKEYPLLLWKLQIENRGRRVVQIDQIEMLSAGFVYRQLPGLYGKINLSTKARQPAVDPLRSAPPIQDIAFFSNGWQSWSYSGVYSSLERYRQTRLGLLRTTVSANPGTPRSRRRGLFGSDMFGVLGDRKNRNAILVGFLSQQQQFGSVEAWTGATPPALRLIANGDDARLEPGKSMITDWACMQFLHMDAVDPLGEYIEAVVREHHLAGSAQRLKESPTGWCSWYQFSTEDYVGAVTALDIQENLGALTGVRPDLPLDILQIDDGFEEQIGDWSTFSPGFHQGVAPLAAEIRRAGFEAGLWLAPFIVHPKSRLAHDHPEWLLRGSLGRPVNAGFLWGVFMNALDLTHPGAMEYAAESVRMASREWGFSYLKLDFLFAGALPGRFKDASKTRAQVLRAGLESLRSAAGEETTLLGCGCPLGPAIGLVDTMRIGADTTRRWLPAFKGIQFFFQSEPDFPSARNASQNALTRAALHQRWWINDPDCLLLRPQTKLTLEEIQTRATIIALTGGSFFLSDHLPGLPADRLWMAEALLPLIGKRPFVLDWFDSATPTHLQLDLEGAAGRWHLLAVFNWDDKARQETVQLSDFYLEAYPAYYAREFWSGRIFQVISQDVSSARIELGEIPAHGCALLAVRPSQAHHPQYIGGNLHISQGLEVSAWEQSGSGLAFCLERPGHSHGHIDVGLPQPPRVVRLNQKATDWETVDQRIYRLQVNFDHQALIELDWGIP
jgi:alpha-galactosidase